MKKIIIITIAIISLSIGANQTLIAQTTKAITNLSKEEQKVIDYIDANMPRAIALLKESVDINSGTLNIECVKKVGAIFAREFEKANFKTKWVPMPDSLRRAGHLVASIGFNNAAENAAVAKEKTTAATEKKSSSKKKNELAKTNKGKKLFLIGHLDTVFEPDMPANPFTMLNESTATGQGVIDMKGGDVVMIIALQALQAQGLLQDANIIAYLTGDEEHAGYPREISRGDFY